MLFKRSHPWYKLLKPLLLGLYFLLFLAVPVYSYPWPIPTVQIAQANSGLVQAVTTTGMTVSNMDQAIAFYQNVLTFQKKSDAQIQDTAYGRLQGIPGAQMRVVQMQLGQEVIELTAYHRPKGRPIPLDSRSNDLWFQHIAIVVRDMDRAYQHLRRFKVQHVSGGPQTLPDYIPAAAGIQAFYFQDPDGHNLEVIYFPPGKGDPRWHQPTDQLFLGIDHTAFGVSDTDQSLQFYRDRLGFTLAGESENYGPEQERLNAVFPARLRISGLKAPVGFGIEFLEYLAPTGGRPYPADAQTNDVFHWQTTLAVDNATLAAQRLQEAGYTLISPGVVTVDGRLGFQRGFLVRDPDGHAMRIVEN